MRRSSTFLAIQIPGWLLFGYLVYAQGLAAFDYDLGVRMGTQEPATQITAVGAAFWYGFALGDLLVYIPVLAIGLIGHWLGRLWGRTALAAALGITVYWPVVCLIAVVSARGATGWHIDDERGYWLVLPIIALWALWGLFQMCRPSFDQDGNSG